MIGEQMVTSSEGTRALALELCREFEDIFLQHITTGEPLQRMREELKSYAHKHDLTELGELAKELFESYNVVESFKQMQVSETISHVPREGTQSSDDDVHSSSTMGTRKLKPNSLNTSDTSPVKGSVRGNQRRLTLHLAGALPPTHMEQDICRN